MLQKIKSVIVEDEFAAREALKNYLSKYCPQVEVIGEAQNIKEAVPMLHELLPQLVFLDVEMPFGNAFDVLEACKELQFETIFVTAFSEYSLKALNQSAAYYLLKPISIEELIVAEECAYIPPPKVLSAILLLIKQLFISTAEAYMAPPEKLQSLFLTIVFAKLKKFDA